MNYKDLFIDMLIEEEIFEEFCEMYTGEGSQFDCNTSDVDRFLNTHAPRDYILGAFMWASRVDWPRLHNMWIMLIGEE